MATIEEIARECAEKVTDRLIYHKGLKSQYGHILDALNKQDRIARAEERERCIQIAQDTFCRYCKVEGECGGLCASIIFTEVRDNIRKG